MTKVNKEERNLMRTDRPETTRDNPRDPTTLAVAEEEGQEMEKVVPSGRIEVEEGYHQKRSRRVEREIPVEVESMFLFFPQVFFDIHSFIFN